MLVPALILWFLGSWFLLRHFLRSDRENTRMGAIGWIFMLFGVLVLVLF